MQPARMQARIPRELDADSSTRWTLDRACTAPRFLDTDGIVACLCAGVVAAHPWISTLGMGCHRRHGEEHLGEQPVMPLFATLALESTIEETVDNRSVAPITLLLTHGLPTSASASVRSIARLPAVAS